MLYPKQFAHAFAPGEFANFPVLDVSNSQTSVKTRHADGSVSHAVFYAILSGNPGQSGTINIIGASTINQQGLSLTQMLAMCPNVELQLWSDAFATLNHSVKLRDMLAFAKVNASGPICTDITVQDINGSFDGRFAGTGTFDANGNRTVRPIWEVKFWPTINRVHVRLVVETSNTTCVQESWYAARVLIDGATVYEHSWDVHPAAKKWFWSQWIGDAVGAVAINHNLAHLAQSRALPNFDTSIKVAAAAIDAWKSNYAKAPLDTHRAKIVNGSLSGPADNAGLWYRGLSQAGTRTDLGIAPEWVIDYLYSGDQDLFNIAIEEAERACNYAVFYREGGNPTIGLGDAPRVDDRPKSDFLQPGNGSFADCFDVTGDRDNWGWTITDRQHFPNPFYALYLITGEHWLLDCMNQWAAFGVGVTNGVRIDNQGRGPTGKEGCLGLPFIYGTRGPAHLFRNLVQAAFICPDDHALKNYLKTCTINTIAAWEGIHRITGTALQTSPCYAWSASVEDDSNPLHWWYRAWYNAAVVDGAFKPNTVFGTVAHWEQGFMDVSLRVAADLGFPSQALIDYRAQFYRAFAASGAPNAWLIGQQQPTFMAAVGADQQLFDSPQKIADCFVDGYNFAGFFYSPMGDLNHGYSILATVGAACIGDPLAWAWYKANAYDKAVWSNNPKWAILPR